MAESENRPVNKEQLLDREKLDEVAEKRRESLHEELERAEKKHLENRSDHDALAKATELARETNTAHNKKDESEPVDIQERRRGAPSKKQLRDSFNTEMKNVRSEMNPVGKLFSKLIHAGPLEKISDAVGSTVAKPNAMLSGSIAAFVCITAVYLLAHYYGYRLSGFETIGAFIIGWVLGVLYDSVSSAFRKNKS